MIEFPDTVVLAENSKNCVLRVGYGWMGVMMCSRVDGDKGGSLECCLKGLVKWVMWSFHNENLGLKV